MGYDLFDKTWVELYPVDGKIIMMNYKLMDPNYCIKLSNKLGKLVPGTLINPSDAKFLVLNYAIAHILLRSIDWFKKIILSFESLKSDCNNLQLFQWALEELKKGYYRLNDYDLQDNHVVLYNKLGDSLAEILPFDGTVIALNCKLKDLDYCAEVLNELRKFIPDIQIPPGDIELLVLYYAIGQILDGIARPMTWFKKITLNFDSLKSDCNDLQLLRWALQELTEGTKASVL